GGTENFATAIASFKPATATNVIAVTNINVLPTTTVVTLGNSGNSGVLALFTNQTIAGLTTSGSGTANAVIGSNATALTLTLTNTSAYTFGGKLGGAGANNNNFNLTKSGSAKLILTGTNSYTGATAVNAGTLLVHGGITGSGVTVGSGATLGGYGWINAPVT